MTCPILPTFENNIMSATCEIFEALLFHGSMDLSTVFTLQTCNKTSSALIGDYTDKLLTDEKFVNTNPITWFARLSGADAASKAVLGSLRLSLRHATPDVVTLVMKTITDNPESVFVDWESHAKFLKACFDFAPDANFRYVHDMLIKLMSAYINILTTLKERNVGQPKVVMSFVLFSKAIQTVIKWMIGNHPLDAARSVDSLITILLEILKVKHTCAIHDDLACLSEEDRIECTHVLKATMKHMSAWHFHISTNARWPIYIGPRGGIYIVRANGMRKYF